MHSKIANLGTQREEYDRLAKEYDHKIDTLKEQVCSVVACARMRVSLDWQVSAVMSVQETEMDDEHGERYSL